MLVVLRAAALSDAAKIVLGSLTEQDCVLVTGDAVYHATQWQAFQPNCHWFIESSACSMRGVASELTKTNDAESMQLYTQNQPIVSF